MAKRRMSHYQLFMASYLRTHLKQGATRAEASRAMREGARAWQRARRGQNPFPGLELFGKPGRPEAKGVPCPECGELLDVPKSAAGQRVTCGECGAKFEVEVQ